MKCFVAVCALMGAAAAMPMADKADPYAAPAPKYAPKYEPAPQQYKAEPKYKPAPPPQYKPEPSYKAAPPAYKPEPSYKPAAPVVYKEPSYQPKPAYKPAYNKPSYKEPELPPQPYQYQYGVADGYTGTQYKATETQDEKGTVIGSYSVNLPDGRIQTVTYRADEYGGFIADVTYEGEASYPPEPEEGYGNSYKKHVKGGPSYAPPKPVYAPAQ